MSDTALEPAPTAGEIWQPMQETVAEFRSECSDLESMIQGLFEDLDRLRVELERKAMELEGEKQRNGEHEGLLRQQCEDAERLTQHLQVQEERLAESLAALKEMRDHFAREHAESAARSREHDDQTRTRMQKLEEESQQLRKQLEESSVELRLMTRSTVELAEAREKFSQAQSEILNLREQLHTASPNVDAKLVAGLERERDELRDEAELLRDRAADLSQNLVDQKVEMDRQRDELTNELRHLRKFVEMQTEMMMNRNPGAAAPAVRSSDAVTSAVMAQFSKVQRDASERRKGRTGT